MSKEERAMRLRVQEDRVVAQISIHGEVATQAAKEACWLPLYLPGDVDHPIGAIHSTTHEVCLRPNQIVTDRQVVVLGPTPISDVPD